MRIRATDAELRIDGGPVIEVTDWSLRAEEKDVSLGDFRPGFTFTTELTPAIGMFMLMNLVRIRQLTHNILRAVTS